MIADIQPLPSNVDEIAAWFRALDAQDLTNGLLGLATIGVVGFLLIVGLMALSAATTRKKL